MAGYSAPIEWLDQVSYTNPPLHNNDCLVVESITRRRKGWVIALSYYSKQVLFIMHCYGFVHIMVCIDLCGDSASRISSPPSSVCSQ
jgi:hypothetical protein